MKNQLARSAFCMCIALQAGSAIAAGPLGIDSKLIYDNQGIWKRSNQKALEYGLIGGELIGAFWEGSDTRLGRTFFQSIDASVLGMASSEVLKRTFRRLRPSQTDDPGNFFKSGGQSFPSGEVTLAAAVVTPFVLEYGHDHPAVYALELLPLYDAEARMKVHGHWQSDVLAGWVLGTLTGYYAHSRHESFTVGVLPHGFTVGWSKQFQ
jgi:acid phosphatase family membrane protein YuiD